MPIQLNVSNAAVQGEFKCSHSAAALIYCNKNVSGTDMHALNASARTQRKPVKQVTTIDAMFPQQPSTVLA